MIVIGTFFAIVIAKQLYGGLGQNPFNPAMVGYVVLLISFPVQMTSWLPPDELRATALSLHDTLLAIFSGHTSQGATLHELQMGVDGISQATPLDGFKTGLRSGSVEQVLQQPLFGGALAGIGWQWVNLGFLAGGLFMLARRLIHWQIPFSMLAAIAFCSGLAWWIDPAHQASPLIHLFSGASMLGAFFIATDPVSASTTPKGRLIYGALIGVLVWLIRVYGGYPDGVAFAVLLANITVPLIDHYAAARVRPSLRSRHAEFHEKARHHAGGVRGGHHRPDRRGLRPDENHHRPSGGAAAKALLDQVVPPENYDNVMQNECFLVSDSALGDGAPHRLYLARKTGNRPPPRWKPPRRTATPGPSSCWSAPISTARCSAPA